MVKDFRGHLIKYKDDFSEIVCGNNLSSDSTFRSELSEIYRSLIGNLNGNTTIMSKDIKPGMLCLINVQKSTNQSCSENSITSNKLTHMSDR